MAASKQAALRATSQTSHLSHIYLHVHPRIGVLRAVYTTLNRKMSFTSHTACVCVAVSTSAFTSHLINGRFQRPPTYATLSGDKKIFICPIFCLSGRLNMHKHADCLHFLFNAIEFATWGVYRPRAADVRSFSSAQDASCGPRQPRIPAKVLQANNPRSSREHIKIGPVSMPRESKFNLRQRYRTFI